MFSSLKTWAKGLRPQQLPDLIFEDTAVESPGGEAGSVAVHSLLSLSLLSRTHC
jgi:hypothetical protein